MPTILDFSIVEDVRRETCLHTYEFSKDPLVV